MNNNNDIASIKTRVLKVFSSQLNTTVTDQIINKELEHDLGLDSSEINTVIIMLEKLYHTPIYEEDCETFNTINDIILFIEKKQQKKYIIKHYVNNPNK